MAAHATLTFETPDRFIAGLRNDLDKGDKAVAVRAFMTELRAFLGGSRRAMIRACLASVAATQTVTCSASAGVPGDTLVIAGTTLTNAASPANENQFADAATDALLAASVAACINANSTLQKIVRATSSGGTLTITCVFPGPIGNLVTLAETGNGFTLGGANLASGASDEVDSYQFGYTPAA